MNCVILTLVFVVLTIVSGESIGESIDSLFKSISVTNTQSVTDNVDRVTVTDNYMMIQCYRRFIEEQTFPKVTTKIFHLHVQLCSVPIVSYASILASNNISAEYVRTIGLVYQAYDSVITGSHIKGLNLRAISIVGESTYKLLRINTNLLKDLINVPSIHFVNVIMPTLPHYNQAAQVALELGSSIGDWGGCQSMNILLLAQWEVPELSNNLLAHCKNLETLILNRMPSKHTVRRVLQGLRTLRQLDISDVDFKLLRSGIFTDADNVEKLQLTKNNIHDFYSSDVFSNLKNLEELDLSDNPLSDNRNTMEAFHALPSLKFLSLRNVKLPYFCDHFNASVKTESPHVQPLRAQSLNMSGSMMSRLCFANWLSVKILDLANNSITLLEIRQLPIYRPGKLEVVLFGNPIKHVSFDEDDYEALKNQDINAQLTVAIDSKLDCDCHGAWFARSVREKVIGVVGTVCEDGTTIMDAPAKRFECDKFHCGGCICRRSWYDNTTYADCTSQGLRALPRVPRLKELLANNNLIETFRIEDLPVTMAFLDLRNNRIARLDMETVKSIFVVKERRLQLSGNPLICDCENYDLIEALQLHKDQVADYKNLTCAGGEVLIEELNIKQLCSNQILTAALLSTGAMVISISALAAVLYCRYGKAIKIFLYARGLCLCCLKEDELDEDRYYDAFISFSHEDETFVIEELMPKLDSDFKICVHYRDWVAGEMIPTQITRSIETSRRTIVVLSKKFVKSLWGLLEFRTAHISALSEGRVRVIVVIIDDVTEDDTLDLQLRGYLLTNTYLKWGDPWFWDKLKYAMPTKKFEAKQNNDIKYSSNEFVHNTGHIHTLQLEMGTHPII